VFFLNWGSRRLPIDYFNHCGAVSRGRARSESSNLYFFFLEFEAGDERMFVGLTQEGSGVLSESEFF
jgi:hypothetical protein